MANKIVFISYARKDGWDMADKLEAWIEDDIGLAAFRDTTTLTWGDDWKNKIDRYIEECFAMIVIVSPEAATSNNVTYEWAYAMGQGKHVLPLLIDLGITEKDVHPKLWALQYIPFHKPAKGDWENLKLELFKIQRQEDVPPAVKKAVDGLDSPLPQDREQAINSLRSIEHPSATNALREAINNHHEPSVYIQAGLALAAKTNYEDDTAIKGIEVAFSKGSQRDRYSAVTVIGNMKNQIAAAECLVQNYNAIKHPEIERVPEIFERFTDPDVIPFLRTLSRKDRYQVRFLSKLAEFNDIDSLPYFAERMKALETGSEPKLNALRGFGQYDHPDMIKPVFDVVVEHSQHRYYTDQQIFGAALDILAEKGGQNALELLESIVGEREYSGISHLIRQRILMLQRRLNEDG